MLQCRCGESRAEVTAGCSHFPTQFPAHRLFLFCCELKFPWSRIKAEREDRRPGCDSKKDQNTEMNRAPGKRRGSRARVDTGWELGGRAPGRAETAKEFGERQGRKVQGGAGEQVEVGEQNLKTAGWAVLQNLPMYIHFTFREKPSDTPILSKFCLQLLSCSLSSQVIPSQGRHPGWASLVLSTRPNCPGESKNQGTLALGQLQAVPSQAYVHPLCPFSSSGQEGLAATGTPSTLVWGQWPFFWESGGDPRSLQILSSSPHTRLPTGWDPRTTASCTLSPSDPGRRLLNKQLRRHLSPRQESAPALSQRRRKSVTA